MQWEECSGRSDAAGIRFGWASFFHFQVDLYRVSLSLADAGTEEPGPRASVWRRAEGQNASCRSHAREMSGVRLAFVRIAVRDRARARGTATAGVTRGADASFVAGLQLTDSQLPATVQPAMSPDPEPAGAASVLRADLDACEARMAQEAAGIEAKVQLVSDETGESGSDAVSKSNATTEPEASPPSSTPDDAPSEIEEVPDDGVRYRCDGKCGFAGTFAEVATHELTCSVVLEQSAGRGNKGGRRETRYACDGNCGFTGSYYEVAAHEATCPVAAKKSDSAGNQQRQVRDVSVKQFRCDGQCGFTG